MSARISKIEPFHDMVGKVPDVEICRLAGVTSASVTLYKKRHGIATYRKWHWTPVADGLDRIEVETGWLYRTKVEDHVALCFVPSSDGRRPQHDYTKKTRVTRG